jgi:FkbM family methyltransferase
MNLELKFMLSLTRRLPKVRGPGVLGELVKGFYLRKRREIEEADVLGFRMRLDPHEFVDRALLFCPQLYDHYEIAFLSKHIQPGDVFFDVGAHIGFYSLVAAKAVGRSGNVVAIEADPYNYEQLKLNLRLNCVENVRALNIGVSDNRETLRLGINSFGNRAGNSFLSKGPGAVSVECYPFSEIITMAQVNKISAAKFDIEGFEYRVLSQFFAEAASRYYPRFIIVEQDPGWEARGAGNAIALLKNQGYRVHWSGKWNYVMVLH